MSLQVVVNGLLIGGVYSTAALGLGLVWGVMSVVNVAHGDLLIFIAYMTGMLLYRLLVRQLVRRSDVELMSLVLFFGLGAIVAFVLLIVVLIVRPTGLLKPLRTR